MVTVDDEIGKQVLFVFLGPTKATIESRVPGDQNWHPYKVDNKYVQSFKLGLRAGILVCYFFSITYLDVFFIFIHFKYFH